MTVEKIIGAPPMRAGRDQPRDRLYLRIEIRAQHLHRIGERVDHVDDDERRMRTEADALSESALRE